MKTEEQLARTIAEQAGYLTQRSGDFGWVDVEDPIWGGSFGTFTAFTDDHTGHFSVELHGVSPDVAAEIVAVLRRAAERRVPKGDVSHAAE